MRVRSWYEVKRSKIKVVQMDKFWGLLDIRKIDRIPETWVRVELDMKKGGLAKLQE